MRLVFLMRCNGLSGAAQATSFVDRSFLGGTMAEAEEEKDRTTDAATPEPLVLSPEVAAEPDPVPRESTQAPPARPSGSGLGRFLALVLGGAVAAGGGFAVAQYGVQQGWPIVTPASSEVEALKAEITRLDAALKSVTDRPAPVADLGPVEARIATLESRPAATDTAALQALEQQVATLESRLAAQNPADAQALASQIDARVAERMQAVTAEAERAQSEAEAAKIALAQRGALIALDTALDSGLDLGGSLTALGDAGIAVPEPLAALAEKPVSLADLQSAFPEAAREALSASRRASQGTGTMTDRLKTFVMNQTNARPLAPQEGEGDEAVLSRMQAGIDAGQLAAARGMVDSLSEPARAAMAAWVTDADIHLAARQALASLMPQN